MNKYKKMPKGAVKIFIIQTFSTVGYAVLLGLLNFYLTDKGGFTKTQANTITASFFFFKLFISLFGRSYRR